MTFCSELLLRNPIPEARSNLRSEINQMRSCNPWPFICSDVSSSVRHVLRDVYLTVRQVRSLTIVVQIMQCMGPYVRYIR